MRVLKYRCVPVVTIGCSSSELNSGKRILNEPTAAALAYGLKADQEVRYAAPSIALLPDIYIFT